MSTENSSMRFDLVEELLNIDYLSKIEFKIAYGIIVSSIILLNGFVILIIFACRSLRETSYNCVTMSLSFTDFIVGCSIRPMISMQESNNFLGCVVAFSFYITAIAASNFHLFLVSLIRTHAFFKDKTIIRKMKKKTTIVIVCLTWLLAIVVVVNENVYWLDFDNPILTAGCNFVSLYKHKYTSVTRFHSLVHLITGLCTVACNCLLASRLYSRLVTRVEPVKTVPSSVDTNTTKNKSKQSEENVFETKIFSDVVEEITVSNTSKTEQTYLDLPPGTSHLTRVHLTQMKDIVRHDLSSTEKEGDDTDLQEIEKGNSATGITQMKDIVRHALSSTEKEGDDTDLQEIEKGNPTTGITTDTNLSVLTFQTKQVQDLSGTTTESVQNKDDEVCSEAGERKFISNPLRMARNRNILAIRTIFIIVALHVVFTGPFYIFLFINGFLVGDVPKTTRAEMILLALATVNSIVNPVVYIIRVPEFRQACVEMKKKVIRIWKG